MLAVVEVRDREKERVTGEYTFTFTFKCRRLTHKSKWEVCDVAPKKGFDSVLKITTSPPAVLGASDAASEDG